MRETADARRSAGLGWAGPGLAAAALLLAACAGPQPRKAAWLVRDRLTEPAEISRACRRAKALGLDRLVVQVRGRGDAWYPSLVAPRAEPLRDLPDGYDPLATAIGACAPVPVAAWFNVFYLWGDDTPPGDPAHPVRAKPGWILTDDRGRRVDAYGPVERALGWIEGIYADPAAPGYRDLFVRAAREVVESHAVDEVHLDFVRYPGPGYGQGGPLGRAFREAWGLDPRLLPPQLRDDPDLGAWLGGSLPPGDRVLVTAALLWAEARAREVTALVRAVRRELDGAGRPVELSAAVWPDPGPAYRAKGQDWRTWAAEGLVDALYPMAYFGPAERVEAQVRAALRWCRPWGVDAWVGLGAFLKEPDRIREEARRAGRWGARRFCLFDWGTLLDRPPGPRPWVEALDAAAPSPGPVARPPGPAGPRSPGGRRLWALVDRWVGGEWDEPPPPGALDARWAEWERAVGEGVFAAVRERAEADPVVVPAWVELDGIFRYLNPRDPPRRVEEQRLKIREARERIEAGEAFEAVARELSQGGTARFGGPLGRRYLTPGAPARTALASAGPGEVVGPVRVANGFWLYRVRRRGPARVAPFAEAPWPARRAAFRDRLNRALAGP